MDFYGDKPPKMLFSRTTRLYREKVLIISVFLADLYYRV
ncbi:hypothetical protein l11_05230 [Neisseria weaveri LMG 5135]|nr:hypothetical protein l11_05230 [Neisseria weaveri LMG 5135]